MTNTAHAADAPSGSPIDPATLYVADFGAAGLDHRCGRCLPAVLADPDNLAAGVTRADYVALPEVDPFDVCEGCA